MSKELERRNMEADNLRKKQLDRIENIVMSNQRALRGSNGDAGLVADVRELQHQSKRTDKTLLAVFVAALAVVGDLVLHLFI